MPKKFNWKDKRLVGAVGLILIFAGILFLYPGAGEERPFKYEPTIDLPEEFMIFVDEPNDYNEMVFVASLSSIAVREDNYNPLFILEQGKLDQHQLWAIEHMDNSDISKIVFSSLDIIT